MRTPRRNALFGQTAHGMSRTPEYRAWQQIRLRCLDPKHSAYPRYGGRGITLHPDWRDDPRAFIAHVGPRPSPKHEIDRIDNNRGYVPGNLRWVTRTENSRNRRSNRLVTMGGDIRTIAEWSELFGIRGDTLRWRLDRGWDVVKALTTSTRPKARAMRAAVRR